MRGRALAIAALIAVVGLACLVGLRATRPRTLAPVEGRPLTAPAGNAGRVVWLEGASGKARMVALRGSRRSVLLERAALSGLAVSGDTACVSAAEGDGQALLRVDLKTGRTQTAARLTAPADEISAGDGWVVWRETRGGDLPGASFVAAADPVTLLRACRAGDGGVRTFVVLHPESDGPLQVSLLGVVGGRAYWLERRQGGAATTVRRASLPDGRPETVVSAAGRRSAALGSDRLVWTGPSREAADPGSLSAVFERPLSGGRERVIGDWIDAQAELAVSGKTVFAREGARVWRLGGELGDQRVAQASITRGAVSGIVGDNDYVIASVGRKYAIVRRPLTWRARVKGLLR